MKCPRCGFDNPDYLEYCQNCSEQLHTKSEDAARPSWGFVKAPQWSDPDFSAETVSEDDIPADFVSDAEAERIRREAERRAAAEAAAEKARIAAEAAAAKRAAEERRLAEEERISALRAEEDRRAAAATAAEAERSAAVAAAAEAERREAEVVARREAEARAAEEARYASRRYEETDRYSYDDPQETVRPAAKHTSVSDLMNSILPGDDDFEDDEPAPRRAVKRPAAREKYAEDDYDDFDDDYRRMPRRQPRRKSSGGGLNLAIRIAAVVALIAVLAIAGFLLSGPIKNCIASGKSPTGTTKAPVIEKNPQEDSSYFVTVFAKEGKVLIYETADGTRREVTVPAKNYVKFNVPESSLMPTTPVDDTVFEAVPKVFIKNEDGTETLIENMGSIMLQVPSLVVTYDVPDEIVSEDGNVTISGHIDLISTELTIDGESVTVNQDGSFSHDIVYEDTGSYTVPVEARLGGYQVYRHSFNVSVEQATPSTPLVQLPWEYGDTSYSQRVKSSLDTIEVRGRIPAGATLTASCESTNASLTAPTVDGEGNFSFNVKMAYPGDYLLKLVCTSESGQVSEREMHVQRTPALASYTGGAWQMNYASFAYASTQAYQISGTVTEILKDDDYILAEMELSDGNKLILEYHHHYGTAGTLEVGRKYSNIFGRPEGLNDDGVPQIYVWFVND